MENLRKFFLFVLLFLLAIPFLLAQETQEEITYRILTRQGNEFIGTLVSENDETIVLKTNDFGEITIRKTDIRRQIIMTPDKMKDGEYWPDNPQSTRYLWTPNGYALEPGEAYYQNIWVLYNQFSFGVSENFSVSAGLVPLFLFAAGVTPFWVVPKFSIPIEKDKVNISVGAFIGTLLGETTGGFGMAFTTLTLGNRDSNVNLGMGWGYAGGDWANFPILNLGMMFRVSPRGYFISENYFVHADGETGAILSFGGRRIINTVGLDFALAIPLTSGMDSFIVLPFLGFTVPLGSSVVR